MVETKQLLDFIAGPESGGNYNAFYGNSRNQTVNLTGMTLGQVQDFQRDLARRTGSSAVGRYQFIQGTLRGLMADNGLTRDMVFTPQLQDMLGERLLERRGLRQFRSGQLSPEQFGNNLAQEWAGLPMLTGPKAGRSYYAGDAIGNASGVSSSDFLALLGGTGAVPVTTYTNPTHNPNPSEFNAQDRTVFEHQPTPAHNQNDWERPEERPKPVFSEVLGVALSTEWAAANIWPQMGGPAPQAGYQLDVKKELEGVPSQYYDRFHESFSPEQTQLIRTRIMREMDQEQTLQDAGWMGTAVRIGAAFTDPFEWAAGAGLVVASNGTGLPLVLAKKFGRLAGVLEGASIGAMVAGSGQAIRNANRETSEMADFYAAAGMGLIFGGAFGGLARNPHLTGEQGLIRKAGEKVLAEGEQRLTVNGSTAGAAQITPHDFIVAETPDWFSVRGNTPVGFGLGLRFDLAASFHRTDNDVAKVLGLNLVEDGTRFRSGETPISVAERKSQLSRESLTRWLRDSNPAFEDYFERSGRGLLDRNEVYDDFMTKVSDFIEDRNPMTQPSHDPAVTRAGTTLRQILSDFHDLGHNPGLADGTEMRSLPGFSDPKTNPHYLPRLVDRGSVTHHLSTFGTETMGRLIGKAMQRVNATLSDELAEKYGRFYMNSLDRLAAGAKMPSLHRIGDDNVEEIKRLLQNESDLTDKEIDAIFAVGNPKSKRGGAGPRGKERLLMDTNFAMELTTMTGEAAKVTVKDLFKRNADELARTYFQQMSGRIALAQTRIRNPGWQPGDDAPEFLVNGINSDGEFNKLLQIAGDYGQKTGATNWDQTRDQLQATYDILLGRPVGNPGGRFAQTLSTLRDAQYIRVMNLAGFAQIPELPQAAAQIGWRAFFSNMPTLKDYWRNAKTGKLDSQLAQEFEDVIGGGTDWLRGTDHRRLDGFDQPLDEFTNSGFLKKVNDIQAPLKRVTTAGSGMSVVNTFLQRATGRAIFNKFGQLSQKTGAKVDKRIQGLGIDQEMLDRILDQYRKHASFDGNRLTGINWESWTDRAAARAFQMGTYRWSRQAIQENELGNMALWMSRPLAQTLLQFRTFQMAGWSKQFMYGLNHMDARMVTAWSLSSLTAGLVYISRTALTSAGRSDRQEYLERRLTVESIASASLQNGSWFTLMAPAIDTALWMAGQPGVFGARSTEQPTDIFLGNPTVGWFNELSTVPAALAELAQGKGTQADARRLLSILYLQNNLLVSNLYSTMVSGLRER